MPIPKTIHFIWAGLCMPHDRLDRILNWKKRNPQFEVILWLDKEGDSRNAIFGKHFGIANNEIRQYLSDKGIEITIRDISEFNNKENEFDWSCVRYEIDKLRPNYGAASDLLRLIILEEHGGAYYDSDVEPVNLLKLPIWDSQGEAFFMHKKSYNDIIVCNKKNPLLIDLKNQVIANYKKPKPIEQIHAAYLSDSPFYINANTLNKSGPNVIYLFGSMQSHKQIIEVSGLRRHEHAESAQSWCGRAVRSIEDERQEELYVRILELIKFEIKNQGIFRLADHLDNLVVSLGVEEDQKLKEESIKQLIERLTPIDFSAVEYAQFNFIYPDLLKFYREKDLLVKTGLLHWDARIIRDKLFNDLSQFSRFLSQVCDIYVQHPQALHSLNKFFKQCAINVKVLSRKGAPVALIQAFDNLQAQADKISEEMLQNVYSTRIYKYLQFAMDYLKVIKWDASVEQMLNELRAVMRLRIQFLQKYISQLKEAPFSQTLPIKQFETTERLNNQMSEALQVLSNYPKAPQTLEALPSFEDLYLQEMSLWEIEEEEQADEEDQYKYENFKAIQSFRDGLRAMLEPALLEEMAARRVGSFLPYLQGMRAADLQSGAKPVQTQGPVTNKSERGM